MLERLKTGYLDLLLIHWPGVPLSLPLSLCLSLSLSVCLSLSLCLSLCLSLSLSDLLIIRWPGAAGDSDAGSVGYNPNDTGGPGVEEGEGDALRLETWRALEHVYERGLVRHIGVSNFTAVCFAKEACKGAL